MEGPSRAAHVVPPPSDALCAVAGHPGDGGACPRGGAWPHFCPPRSGYRVSARCRGPSCCCGLPPRCCCCCWPQRRAAGPVPTGHAGRGRGARGARRGGGAGLFAREPAIPGAAPDGAGQPHHPAGEPRQEGLSGTRVRIALLLRLALPAVRLCLPGFFSCCPLLPYACLGREEPPPGPAGVPACGGSLCSSCSLRHPLSPDPTVVVLSCSRCCRSWASRTRSCCSSSTPTRASSCALSTSRARREKREWAAAGRGMHAITKARLAGVKRCLDQLIA
jgi:hypothetical protein